MSRVNLKAERLRRGKSLAAMAKEIDVTVDVLAYAERGGKSRPRPENAVKIATAYGFDVLEQWPVEEAAEAAA